MKNSDVSGKKQTRPFRNLVVYLGRSSFIAIPKFESEFSVVSASVDLENGMEHNDRLRDE